MTQIFAGSAIVTGASSGIGAATALELAKRGASLALLARDQERLGGVQREIGIRGGLARTYAVDLANPERVASTARSVIAEMGSPDVVVHCAGSGRWLSITQTSAGELEASMALPYFAAFNLTRELLPFMISRGRGRIVLITSVASRLSWPNCAAYAAARCAVTGFARELRTDLYGTGVGVTLATFGAVESAQAAQSIAEAIERDAREIVEPAAFRWLFFVNAIAPGWVERYLRKHRTRQTTQATT
jgi:uncharacterized protein